MSITSSSGFNLQAGHHLRPDIHLTNRSDLLPPLAWLAHDATHLWLGHVLSHYSIKYAGRPVPDAFLPITAETDSVSDPSHAPSVGDSSAHANARKRSTTTTQPAEGHPAFLPASGVAAPEQDLVSGQVPVRTTTQDGSINPVICSRTTAR